MNDTIVVVRPKNLPPDSKEQVVYSLHPGRLVHRSYDAQGVFLATHAVEGSPAILKIEKAGSPVRYVVGVVKGMTFHPFSGSAQYQRFIDQGRILPNDEDNRQQRSLALVTNPQEIDRILTEHSIIYPV